MAQAILIPALAALGGFGASALLNKPSAPAPTPAAPKVMPIADDQSVQDAKRRSLMMQIGRGGRTSTMLTDPSSSDTLGN